MRAIFKVSRAFLHSCLESVRRTQWWVDSDGGARHVVPVPVLLLAPEQLFQYLLPLSCSYKVSHCHTLPSVATNNEPNASESYTPRASIAKRFVSESDAKLHNVYAPARPRHQPGEGQLVSLRPQISRKSSTWAD